MFKIAIIGCGIGGATAALALHRAGHDVRVFERAAKLSEVGAGIGLMTNAMRALDTLSIGNCVRARGHIFHIAELWTSGRYLLQRMKLEEIVGENAPTSCIIHRADLLSIILENLPSDSCSTSRECIDLQPLKNGVRIHFSNKTNFDADLVIGADGLNSFVRSWLFGESPIRYAGQTCFRGIARFNLDDRHIIREISGKAQRASAMPIDDDRVYWWAALNWQREKILSPNLRRQQLLSSFKDWPFGISECIAKTPAESILQNDIVDRLPLSSWSRGRITLLGDAAHPMAPNLGQGACTSIEDALTLAQALNRFGDDYLKVFSFYENQRIERTSKIARLSWLYGLPYLWQNPLAVASRNILTRLVPKVLVCSQFKEILGYHI